LPLRQKIVWRDPKHLGDSVNHENRWSLDAFLDVHDRDAAQSDLRREFGLSQPPAALADSLPNFTIELDDLIFRHGAGTIPARVSRAYVFVLHTSLSLLH